MLWPAYRLRSCEAKPFQILMPKFTPPAPDGRNQRERAEWGRRWRIPSVTSLHDAAIAGVDCEPSRRLEEAAGLTFEEAVAAALR